MGVSKGFPDVFVPLVAGHFHGFFLEMKRPDGGKLSAEQAEWLDYLRGEGYFAEVAHGFDEAQKLFNYYLSFMLKAA